VLKKTTNPQRELVVIVTVHVFHAWHGSSKTTSSKKNTTKIDGRKKLGQLLTDKSRLILISPTNHICSKKDQSSLFGLFANILLLLHFSRVCSLESLVRGLCCRVLLWKCIGQTKTQGAIGTLGLITCCYYLVYEMVRSNPLKWRNFPLKWQKFRLKIFFFRKKKLSGCFSHLRRWQSP
jgi:hypothetical protein